MADLGSTSYSEADASNTAAPPNGWPEGMAPSDVNNSARANMGAEKRFWDRINAVKTTTGTTTAYVLTYDVAAASYYDGELHAFVIDQACGSAPTLNINGLGARNLRKGVGHAALVAGDLIANQVIVVRYNLAATAFDIVGGQSVPRAAIQTFAATGTYTPNANMSYCIIECWGGGGGGGGCATGGGGIGAGAGGGGGASYALKLATAAAIGVSQVVTIGAGGAGGAAGNNPGSAGASTSVGSLCVAPGAAGGGGSGGGGVAAGGSGGNPGTGDDTPSGTAGGVGSSGTAPVVSGYGGSSRMGLTPGVISAVSTGGNSAVANSGCGGSGGASYNAGGAQVGGNGGSGYVKITEYLT